MRFLRNLRSRQITISAVPYNVGSRVRCHLWDGLRDYPHLYVLCVDLASRMCLMGPIQDTEVLEACDGVVEVPLFGVK